MVVYRLSERSRGSGGKLIVTWAKPNHRCLGAHGQVALAGMGVMAFVLAAAAFVIGVPTDNNVVQIVAGDNITISPVSGYGVVTINSTGVGGGAAAENENNVTKIIAGENITISPENGYGLVTISVSENIENKVNMIRPSQLYEKPVGADDGKFPQYEDSLNQFTWVNIDRGEGHITIFPINYNSSSGDWKIIIDTNFMYNHIFYNYPTPVINDELNFKAYLATGTYSMRVIWTRNPDAGIVEFLIDGTSIENIDQYGSLIYATTTTSTGITPTGGIVIIKMKITGKNASSSNYYCRISQIVLWRIT